MMWLHQFHIRNVPIVDAVLPIGKAFAHQRSMLGFIERDHAIRVFQIDQRALLRKATAAFRGNAAFVQAVQGKRG